MTYETFDTYTAGAASGKSDGTDDLLLFALGGLHVLSLLGDPPEELLPLVVAFNKHADSKGTKHMVKIAREAGVSVLLYGAGWDTGEEQMSWNM